ncbi:ParB/Srx family N-terminal domain-containing protein [Methylocapsa palsarum]|uniref:Putative ParB-like nuclease n=1 Tax=Methylocapsa palsarum TaxID=1612308 RepID=A0A1I3XVR5_9HYPH|nr:ParB/Srx family N-terminal domain-containing protein [Methylocapsa palsarum]SFK23602.1 Putative ParB-like nuclease [Methylocapsa palsarum]
MVRTDAPLLLFLILTASAVLPSSAIGAPDRPPPCADMTDSGKNCSCDLRSLRPLQGAIGLYEVAHKEKRISEDPSKAEDKLKKDPIKVVRGPNGDLFIVDHHHGALAWLDAGFASSICIIQHPELSTDPALFWDQLAEKKLDHLEDKNGVAIPHEKLPRTLFELRSEDDPYRSLAGLMRKDDGFCRDSSTPNSPNFVGRIS